MIVTEKFIHDLDNYMKVLNQNYSINSGGCCYVAYVIAKKLESLHIHYKLVIFDGERCFKRSKLAFRKSIKLRTGLFTIWDARNHYAIQVGKTIINLNRFNTYHKVALGCIKSDDIKYLYDHGHWNDTYDIRDNDTIKELINKFFDEYEERN